MRDEETSMLQKAPMYAYIPVKDVARARQFYEQKVGLTAKEERAGGVVYEFANGTACFLYPTPNAGTSRASQAFWDVDDVEREVADLKRRGVKFEEYDMPQMKTVDGIAVGGDAKAAWFKDTEGNIMALIQTL
jgi:predicted enzyme related to lactoylglutathione lyase